MRSQNRVIAIGDGCDMETIVKIIPTHGWGGSFEFWHGMHPFRQ
jgi:hypothetical protein